MTAVTPLQLLLFALAGIIYVVGNISVLRAKTIEPTMSMFGIFVNTVSLSIVGVLINPNVSFSTNLPWILTAGILTMIIEAFNPHNREPDRNNPESTGVPCPCLTCPESDHVHKTAGRVNRTITLGGAVRAAHGTWISQPLRISRRLSSRTVSYCSCGAESHDNGRTWHEVPHLRHHICGGLNYFVPVLCGAFIPGVGYFANIGRVIPVGWTRGRCSCGATTYDWGHTWVEVQK